MCIRDRPMTMPISVSTTRISIRVMPRIAAMLLDKARRATSRCDPACKAHRKLFCMVTLSPGHGGPDRLERSSGDKFAHSHDPEENREHDSADKHREPEYQCRLEHG